METTTELVHNAKNGKRMNTLENFYIQFFQHDNTIIKERSHLRPNSLFQIAYDIQSRDTNIEPPT
jgi:hypothetical protein